MSGPAPAVAALRAAVRRACADLPPGALVLVACSGGPDSLALAAAAGWLGSSHRTPWRAGAVVVDHGLQPGSAEVAARAAAQCGALGLAPVEVAGVDVTPGAAGPEAAARSARHRALGDAAARHGAAAVLLGHTLDDQAEQVLLGLARGSGARSLAGMPERRGLLRRPLLRVARTTTLAACRVQGLAPWHDPTNADPAFTRARVRSAVLPVLEAELGPGVASALARTAAQLREDAELLEAVAAQLLEEVRLPAAAHEVVLDARALAAAPAALRRRALRSAVVEAGSPPSDTHRQHVEAVDALLTDWRGQGRIDLPGGVGATRACGRLALTRRPVGARARGRTSAVDADDMGKDLDEVLISEDDLQARLRAMAADVDADYAGRDLLLVGVLKGAVMVMADFARALHLPAEMDWMAVSSYGSGTKSSGVVRILKDLDRDVTGRHVLIVEDIIDSGLTLSWLVANLGSRGAASVEVLTLLRKPEAAKVAVDVRYVGFDIPSAFVVGYGLDYDERYRNLPFVGTLAPHVYSP